MAFRMLGSLDLDGDTLKFEQGSGNATSLVASGASSDKTLTLPNITDTIVTKTSIDTLTNKTLTTPTLTSPVLTTPQINDTSEDHQYIFAVSELTSDRTVTLPLLTGNDDFVFEDHAQTLTNKTVTALTTSAGSYITMKTQSVLRLEDDSGTDYVGLDAPAGVTTWTLTLPSAAPSSSSMVIASTDSSGNTAWASELSSALGDGTFFVGNGSNVATAVTMSGDVTFTNAAVSSIKSSVSLTTPILGVATATSINKLTITAPASGSTLTIADGKALTCSNTLTLAGTDSSTVTFGTGGTVAYTANKLSAFAATTSAELITVMSDETGTGGLVFSSNCVLGTPQINDSDSSHQYQFAVSNLADHRTITLPLLTGNDEFVFKDHTVTMTNKTFTSPNITGIVGGSHGYVGAIEMNGGLLLNENAGDIDFRAETDNHPGALFLDGATGWLLVGSSESSAWEPKAPLHVKNHGSSAISNLHADTELLVQHSEATGENCFINAVSGTTGDAGVYLGATDVPTEAGILYDNNTSLLNLRAGAVNLVDLSTTETVFNETNADTDFRVEADNEPGALFLNGANGWLMCGGSTDTSAWAPKAPLHVQNHAAVAISDLHADTQLLVQHSAAAGENSYISVVSGTTGDAGVYLGATDVSTEGGIRYDNNGQDLFLRAAGADKVIITESGEVGIGDLTPSTKLHVATGTTGTIATFDGAIANDAEQGRIIVSDSGTQVAMIGMRFETDDGATEERGFWGGQAGDGGTYYTWVDQTGDLRISNQFVHVGLSTAGAVVGDQSSDERLKSDITPVTLGLSEVNKLKPIKYKRNERFHLGFGAQETAKIIPEAVYDTKEDRFGDRNNTKLSMSYVQIIPVLVKAVQELSKKVVALEGK